MKEKVVEVKQSGSGLAKAAQILAIVIFSVTMACLLTTTISDVAIFSEQITKFIGGVIVCAILFIFMLICYVVSFILIFGFYLQESKGFWPFTVTKNAFFEILDDINFKESQVVTMNTIRWVVLILCILCFIGSIVALSLNKASKKKGFEGNLKPSKKFSVVTLVFSVLGIGVAAFVLLITSSVL